MNALDTQRLAAAVQTNCHIADARHAADLPLCIYLLQMREFFRWEQQEPWGALLERPAVGAWIAERESLWAQLEEQPLRPLPCAPGADEVDAFDVGTVNAHLRHAGLFYGAGLLGADRPVFFLAEQHARGRRDGVPVWTTGRELARCLLAPPAMLVGGDDGGIVLRRESLARWCWEKYEAYTLRPRTGGSAFDAVVHAYGLDRDFAAALPRWLDEQGEALTLHELGEHRVGARLGPGWAAMRLALPSRRADLYARAVRDHLADLDTTLPTLLERQGTASVHAWFANFDGIRQLLFPSLDAAYAAWRQGDGGRALRLAIARGMPHFRELAERALELHDRGDAAGAAIERLLTSPAAVCPR